MDLNIEELDFYIEEEDFNAFKRAFEIFDADGSGKMNFTEVDKLIMELSSGQDPTDEEVVELMKQLDQDESGMVEFEEFVRVMAKRAEETKILQKEREFREAFRMFDRDGSGKVSSTELRQVLTKSGQMKLTDEEVDEMVEGVDEDHDGMIDFNELVKMFTGAGSIRELVTGEKEENEEDQEDVVEDELNSTD
eukprot:TRINITY_DN17453_c0_g1_i1.p1 TRINITY_DN17453_c0_g1~~TRINITY_DN17453_c0_g1_i1.p1  ORF type:complete len:193 (-),score=72.28 TRINITY_DN17453_c0_g1_i1:157-735(-)